MVFKSLRYRRREFLGICATVPLVAELAASVEPVEGADDPLTNLTLDVPKVAEADLAREVEALLMLVDPQVVYRPVSLADEKNAWHFWEQALKVYVEEPYDEEFQQGIEKFVENKPDLKDDVRARILDWIGQNEACRKLIDQGIAVGAIDLPRETKSFRLSLVTQEAFRIRSLARLKQRWAIDHLRQKKIATALDEANSVLTMATMQLRSECVMVDYLMAQAILGIGVQAIYRICSDAGTSDEQRRSCLQELAKVKPVPEDLARSLRVEYCCWLLPYIAELASAKNPQDLATRYFVNQIAVNHQPTESIKREYTRSIRQTAALLEGHPKPFDKEATVRLGSDFNLHLIAGLKKPWLKRDGNLLDKLQKDLSAWPAEIDPDWWILFSSIGENPNPRRALTDQDLSKARDALRKVENPLGKRVISEGSPFVHSILEVRQAHLESMRIGIALRMYERKYSKLPGKLDDLVDAKLLPEVPLDPFDGKPFRYSKERRIVWCVGQEGKNEGNLPEKEGGEDPGSDLSVMTWRVEKL